MPAQGSRAEKLLAAATQGSDPLVQFRMPHYTAFQCCQLQKRGKASLLQCIMCRAEENPTYMTKGLFDSQLTVHCLHLNLLRMSRGECAQAVSLAHAPVPWSWATWAVQDGWHAAEWPSDAPGQLSWPRGYLGSAFNLVRPVTAGDNHRLDLLAPLMGQLLFFETGADLANYRLLVQVYIHFANDSEMQCVGFMLCLLDRSATCHKSRHHLRICCSVPVSHMHGL